MYAHCKNCGRVIVDDDWCYVHLDGWANCRLPEKQDELDNSRVAEVLTSHPIDPQPASDTEARNIPIIAFVVDESGVRHPWRKGDPMPTLTITC